MEVVIQTELKAEFCSYSYMTVNLYEFVSAFFKSISNSSWKQPVLSNDRG